MNCRHYDFENKYKKPGLYTSGEDQIVFKRLRRIQDQWELYLRTKYPEKYDSKSELENNLN